MWKKKKNTYLNKYTSYLGPSFIVLNLLERQKRIKSKHKMLLALNKVIFYSQTVQIKNCLISPPNICCRYSLEVPLQGTSNEYPRLFLLKNKKIIHLNILLILSYDKSGPLTRRLFIYSWWKCVFIFP